MADYVRQPFVAHIPHYYGDYVRQLFTSVAAILLIGSPFYSSSLGAQLPLEIIGAIVLVGLAAFANPHTRWVFAASAVVSGIGLAIFQMWALSGYEDGTLVQFLIRELLAILFLIAFYFSMKTVRAFAMDTIGKTDEAGEFEDEPHASDTSRPAKKSSVKDEFHPWTHQKSSRKENAGATSDESGPRMSPGRSREEIMPKNHPYEEQL